MAKTKRSISDRYPILSATLGVVAAAGMLSVALVAPNAVQILKIFDHKRRGRITTYVNSKLPRLEQKGLIRSFSHNGQTHYELTKAGELWLEKEKLKRRQRALKSKKWGGFWYIVIFDIRELARKKRDQLRIELKEYGFVKLQNSVWITPHDCTEIVDVLKQDLMLGKDLIYMKVVVTSSDKYLLKKFGLKQ